MEKVFFLISSHKRFILLEARAPSHSVSLFQLWSVAFDATEKGEET